MRGSIGDKVFAIRIMISVLLIHFGRLGVNKRME